MRIYLLKNKQTNLYFAGTHYWDTDFVDFSHPTVRVWVDNPQIKSHIWRWVKEVVVHVKRMHVQLLKGGSTHTGSYALEMAKLLPFVQLSDEEYIREVTKFLSVEVYDLTAPSSTQATDTMFPKNWKKIQLV